MLTVNPVDDGIYDAAGNEANTDQGPNNTDNLNDKLPPTLAQDGIVVNQTIEPNTITLTFSEPLETSQAGDISNYNLPDGEVTNNDGSINYDIADASVNGAVVTLTLATINAANPDPATFLANTDVDGKIKVTPSTDITDIAGIAYEGDEITELNASHFLEDDPVVERVWSSNADDTYNKPDVINIIITFDENVYVGGSSLPQLTLETGPGGANYPADAVVDYSIGSSTDDLTFPYTEATGHIVPTWNMRAHPLWT